MMDHDDDQTKLSFVGELTKKERRVLGVLIEKSLTTPEYYPLTLKALTTGCNQKSNRSPLSNYDEYDVEEILDGLRGRGLVASVHSAGGRSERYRHLLRDSTGWNNRKLAIMGELLLRGRQQTGELRSRASRMAEITSLDELREELTELQTSGYVQSTGELQRRGIEVDHALYLPEENKTLAVAAGTPDSAGGSSASAEATRFDSDDDTSTTSGSAAASSFSTGTAAASSASAATPASDALAERVTELEQELTRLADRVAELERLIS